MPDYTLLTGATGFLGRFLLRDLLQRGHRLAVLVRSNGQGKARDRVEDILSDWEQQGGNTLPRPICLEGNMASRDLGISTKDQQWIHRHCDRVIHSAAVLGFQDDNRTGEPHRTNVEGTRQLLQLCERSGISDFHYVSTAYVCGCRDDLVREDDLDCGQAFRNTYEDSKCQAEKLVRGASFLDHATIYRPAVIAGDSTTGFTTQFHGVYTYLRMASLLLGRKGGNTNGETSDQPIRLNLTGQERRHVIPVDWVSEVICHLVDTPQSRDHTFHLVPPRPSTAGELIGYAGSYYNVSGLHFCGADSKHDASMNEQEEAFYLNTALYVPYMTSDPCFDTTNLRRFAGHLPCPQLDEAMMQRYARFGEAQAWGKRRFPRTTRIATMENRNAACIAPNSASTADPLTPELRES